MLSEAGCWGEDRAGPLSEFHRAAGCRVEFCTPKGRRLHASAASIDRAFSIHHCSGRSSRRKCRPARARSLIHRRSRARLDNPITLAAWFPENRYFAASQFVRDCKPTTGSWPTPSGARNTLLDFVMGPPAYPFITGRLMADSGLTRQKMIEVLDGDPPLRRWRW